MLVLKKAFDTVHHETLIDKLKLYDLDDKCIAWFKDYLSNRSHNVAVNGISSKQVDCVCGIPQGSILGPLFFIIKKCKHLGVIIDENLSWNDHVQHIEKKVKAGLYYLN